MKNIYLIKDLARLTHHSVYTLKYYLNEGLIQEIGRSPVTNFRFFDDSSIKRIEKIRKLKKNGNSLEGIKLILNKNKIGGS